MDVDVWVDRFFFRCWTKVRYGSFLDVGGSDGGGCDGGECSFQRIGASTDAHTYLPAFDTRTRSLCVFWTPRMKSCLHIYHTYGHYIKGERAVHPISSIASTIKFVCKYASSKNNSPVVLLCSSRKSQLLSLTPYPTIMIQPILWFQTTSRRGVGRTQRMLGRRRSSHHHSHNQRRLVSPALWFLAAATTTTTTWPRSHAYSTFYATTLGVSRYASFLGHGSYLNDYYHGGPTDRRRRRPTCRWLSGPSDGEASLSLSSSSLPDNGMTCPRSRGDTTQKEDDNIPPQQKQPPLRRQYQQQQARQAILDRNPEPEDAVILNATLDWVEHVVIGLNLCPFAESPYQGTIPTNSSDNGKDNTNDNDNHHDRHDRRRFFCEVIHGCDETEIVSRVLGECLVRKDQPRTTSLMICPDLYPTNFDTFLQVYNILNEGILQESHSPPSENENDDDVDDEEDLSTYIQIAPFHPLFQFEGSAPDGVDNYTNRSPYPMFHILREDDVGYAVDVLDGDASQVWKRNVELLEALGDEFDDETMKRIMSGKRTLIERTVQDKVQEILKAVKRKRIGTT
jgi:uncharacterized protein